MKTFCLLPALTAFALLASPSTGFSDHKIAVYRDRDHDGHYNKKTIEISNHHYYRSGVPSSYYSRPYSYAPYYYGGPALSFSFSRTYPRTTYYSDDRSYSDGLAEDVQAALRRRGYYRGEIDGDIGPGTRAAIRAYQYDRGFAVTGRIDSTLLRSLNLG